MRILLATLFFVLTTSVTMAAGARYFSALSDLPLPANLTEDTHSAVRFDQPEGRVIVLQATGTAQPNEIKQFYNQALPALGWKQVGTNRYSREDETLTLDIKPLDASHNRVNILLKPE